MIDQVILEKVAWLISKTLPVHVSSMIYIVLLIITVLITRAIIIKHFLRYHVDELTRDKIKELTALTVDYKHRLDISEQENKKMIANIKGIKSVWEDV